MKFQTLAAVAVSLAPALACELYNLGRDCTWEGSWPMCGTTKDPIGITVDGRTLVEWTRDIDWRDICKDARNRDNDCCKHYGHFCVSGYKRLWCKHYTGPNPADIVDNVLDKVLPVVVP
ncbi:Uncharacterized protein PECH_004750 [Penicillium ucsense]|uniref:Hydrophobin n=1 Tax=Penicillium ucsense TaxID=2839758 RepID=A0A8J8W594_9EURO|nr:Uncharacterized protein PECM_006781 [Penicillium ucsense]KAF7739274.1 Uncharacterized protein PECH_004750 [Penicillium ucsense]